MLIPLLLPKLAVNVSMTFRFYLFIYNPSGTSEVIISHQHKQSIKKYDVTDSGNSSNVYSHKSLGNLLLLCDSS